MKRFYATPTRVDAYLLRDRLRHAGIDAHVFNEHASSIVGDLPPEVAWLQVWLDDDADMARAQQALAAWNVERARTGEQRCLRCGEDNPATFELCWKCGASVI
jgi:ribosomal protein L40E